MSDEVILGRIIPLIFLLVGLGLLTGAAVCLARTRSFLARAAEARGEVVALEEEPATEAGDPRTYRPVVSFRIGGGEPLQFASTAHGSPPEYEVGDSVTVVYDRDRPNDARIHSFVSLWLLPIILGALGLTFTMLGAALLLGVITP